MRDQLFSRLLAGYGAVHALPTTDSITSAPVEAFALRSLSPHPISYVMPADYPEYRALAQLTITNASDPRWNGAGIVKCSEQTFDFELDLCVSRNVAPYPVIFQDVLGVPLMNLSRQGNWAQHPEAFLPMSSDLQLASTLSSTARGSTSSFPTNRLFEGILLDSQNRNRIVTWSAGSQPTFVGRYTNSSVYVADPWNNAVNYLWTLCLPKPDAKNQRKAKSMPWLALRRSWNCDPVSVEVKMDIVEVMGPRSGREKTFAELPYPDRWRDSPVPDEELWAEKTHYEEVILSINAKDRADVDGLPIKRCDPKPFYDFPPILALGNGQRNRTIDDLLRLRTTFGIYYRTMSLCANATVTSEPLVFESLNHLSYFPREKSPLILGHLLNATGIENWDHSDGVVGFNAQGLMHHWLRWPDARYGEPSTEFQLCTENHRGKTVRVLHQYDPAARAVESDQIPIFKPQPGGECISVGVRMVSNRTLDPADVDALATANMPAKNTDPAVPKNVVESFGGRRFEYYDWVYNISSLLPGWFEGKGD